MTVAGVSMEALPYYRWLWRDWRANRKVQRMSWQARGLYRELLDEFWSEGSIPADLDQLADICGCTRAEMEQFWPQIEPSWERIEGGYRNGKMESQRTSKDAERITKANSGRKGGLACNSRTRADESLADAKHVLADAKDIEAQPDIAVAVAVAEQEQEQEQTPSPSARRKSKGDTTAVVLPAFLPETEWQEWLRVKKGAKTPYAQQLAIDKLTGFHAEGYDVKAILNSAIEGAWATVYANESTPKRKVVYEEVDPATFWAGTGIPACQN
jgi:uncharacterized protein YdaU (DUF1376 family)